MQMEKARKEAMMQELKHYINGKFAELEKKLMAGAKAKVEAVPKKIELPKKIIREKAIKE